MKYADIYVNLPVDGPFTYSIPEGMTIAEGCRVRVPFGAKKVVGYVERIHANPPREFAAKDILEAIDTEPVFDGRIVALARYIAETYICRVGEVLGMALPSGKSSLNRYKRPRVKNPQSGYPLSDEQQQVYDALLEGHAAGKKNHLLFGVTGSGKTEVYIALAKHFIGMGKSVIYLVPEITLSSQIFERLHNVFGDELVLYHSNLTANQRLDSWQKFYRGEARIAVGTRSAVFLQSPDPGMIIVDEEHDGSYKEHRNPRYNARRIALYRSNRENMLVLFGSATPSIESLYGAEKNILMLHTLKERYGNARLPEIQVVQVETGKVDAMLSAPLKLYTKRVVEEGRQVIYLLNRRGFSPIVLCEMCGSKVECPDCSISMNYHSNGKLICHYCGHMRPLPEHCPVCEHDTMAKVGAGTQRIEELVNKTFANFAIFRLDQDTSRKKDTMANLIDTMQDGSIDILLGTQMVSKGFDFKNVALVGVLLADIGMNLPDFRATERIFALLMQVSGRCGRGDVPGKVIIQTLNQDSPLFSFLKQHDYFAFYRSELASRQLLQYPPFSRIVRFLVRGKEEARVTKAINQVGEFISTTVSVCDNSVTMLGPAPAPLEKIGGNYRHHIIVKAQKHELLKQLARDVHAFFKSNDTYLEIDVDPYDML